MNYKQFSTIQRCIGRLDGMGFGLDVFTRPVYLSVLEELSNVIEELRPEIEEGGGKEDEE